VAIACTGSQGEPTSALVRMAMGEHRQVNIRPGDTVIVSATPIPGNEEFVNRTLNNLFRAGAEVHYSRASAGPRVGHGSREEHKLHAQPDPPAVFRADPRRIPPPGASRAHGQEMGIPGRTSLSSRAARCSNSAPIGGASTARSAKDTCWWTAWGLGDVGNVVLRDRHLLSRDGFVVVVVAVDAEHRPGRRAGPHIITRGFVYLREAGDLIDEASQCVLAALAHGGPGANARTRIKEDLAEFLYTQTKRRPMILPVVLEV
jgi:ribonuclease J